MTERFRWLDFDCEVRPLSYLGQDFTTGDVTCIAWGWADEQEVHAAAQTKDWRSARTMLRKFKTAFDAADGVTGHYIRAYDLPVLQGAMVELELPLLSDKMTCDTKLDLKRFKYLSKSQENLAEMLDLPEPKVHMNTPRWRKSNRLTQEGIALTLARCISDVQQHKALRAKLLELNMLTAPKVWYAGHGHDAGVYQR